MSLKRFFLVVGNETKFNVRRPLFWILVLIMGLIAYGLSSGVLQIASGDSRVGGTKAWITSEFAIGQILTMVGFLCFSFFIAVAAGMSVLRDDELKVGEIIHSTPLKPGEYIWGKFVALLLAFFGVMGLYLAFMAFFNHLVPSAQTAEIRGPFAIVNYLRPTLYFVVPAFIFLIGVSFAVGELTRRPILLFALPVAAILACGFFLWEWSPTWLDPRINQVLMLIDPAGFRWLNETWLKVDKGVDFYNHGSIGMDWPFLASRLVFLFVGLGSMAFSHWHFSKSLRGKTSASWAKKKALAMSSSPGETKTVPSLASLGMKSESIGFLRALFLVTRAELRELRSQPGLYLFVPMILLQTVGTSFEAVGAFGTPLLQTPGTLAVGSMNVLTFFLCLLMMFYMVESLQRERVTGIAAIHFATPVRTAAFLFGKALANSLIGVVVLLATVLGYLGILLYQGQVSFALWPFALVWGLLLLPTFLGWTSFVTAVYALTQNRYTSYAIALAALIFTGYRQLSDKMNWVGNWALWGALKWSDMGVFELDRTALILNRVMVLGLSVFFTALAVKAFRRRDVDSGRLMQRLYPWPLLKTGFRLSPYAAIPLISGMALYGQVYLGYEGSVQKKIEKDYWRSNLATWKDAVLPGLTAVDIDLELDPPGHFMKVQGSYELINHRQKPIRQFPLTGGAHWENVKWTLNGNPYEPENRTHLFVFTPPTELAPGAKVRIGFAFDGKFPRGSSQNGKNLEEFILPAGVVLTSFRPSFCPLLGFTEEVGIDKDNKYETKVYADDFYEGITEPGFGSGNPFTTRIRITAPQEYLLNSVGTMESQVIANGKRTVVWKTDQPVRFFNVIGGLWQEQRGKNTVVYFHDAHRYNIPEISAALDAARKYYSEWFYPYPWKELKLSEFSNLATYAQGFPTNITFSEGIGFLTQNDPKVEAAFIVTAHEAAHQWWGNILTPGKGPGGNILCEGMAHFSTILLAEQVKGLRSRIEFCKRIEESYGLKRFKDSELSMVKTDGSKKGDTTVTYDKGGWVFWMLLNLMGRDNALAGIQAFIEKYHAGPDYPVLQDFVAFMRQYAPDARAYDEFVKQWFFDVVVPEYRLVERKCAATQRLYNENEGAEMWQVTLKVRNAGTGTMPVEVAAVAGERFLENNQPDPSYQEAKSKIQLSAGETKEVTIRCPFKPDRVLMDPDAKVLQLQRKAAIFRF